MKVLFLDIDGVLNNFTAHNFKDKFSEPACKNLNTLLQDVPDLSIVISSSWRHRGLDKMKEVLEKNGIDPKRAIDITGDEDGERGNQIRCWLDRNPETSHFVIFDDNSDMESVKDNFVKINGYVGLTSADVDKAKEILNKE